MGKGLQVMTCTAWWKGMDKQSAEDLLHATLHAFQLMETARTEKEFAEAKRARLSTGLAIKRFLAQKEIAE